VSAKVPYSDINTSLTSALQVTFTDFNWADGEASLPESKFQVPPAYSLDPYRCLNRPTSLYCILVYIFTYCLERMSKKKKVNK
jgi:hypothetical protein